MYKVRLLLISLCAFLTAFTIRELHLLIEYGKPLNLLAVSGNGQVSAYERSLRPIWPYSVIPGGAYNVDELRYYMSKDKIVRNHYADFDVDHARVVSLTQDRYQYVSYRIKNAVYWTQRKVRIPKGEVLITDGKNFARTRCGNRLCATIAYNHTFPFPRIRVPQFPDVNLGPEFHYAFAEPPDLPWVPDNGPAPYLPPPTPYVPPLPQLWPAVEAPVVLTPVYPSFPVVPTPAITPPSTPPVPFATPEPEPATVYLFPMGSIICLWLAVRWTKQRRVTEDES